MLKYSATAISNSTRVSTTSIFFIGVSPAYSIDFPLFLLYLIRVFQPHIFCNEPKSIDELRDAGLHRIRAARKGKDSVNNGIQYIQGYTIIVHPRCVNFITEISNYTWAEDKFGAKINVPIDDFNHLMDAMRYGLEDMLVGPAFSFD